MFQEITKWVIICGIAAIFILCAFSSLIVSQRDIKELKTKKEEW